MESFRLFHGSSWFIGTQSLPFGPAKLSALQDNHRPAPAGFTPRCRPFLGYGARMD